MAAARAAPLAEPGEVARPAPGGDGISRNLNGQKLGRKGKVTRERILAAAAELVSQDLSRPISLSAVARKASLGMTSLYLYFSDLTELLLAVLEPVMATAEQAYVEKLRTRWPDEKMEQHCRDFISAYLAFWQHNARLLHLRNTLADRHDQRMLQFRVDSAQSVIHLIVRQMDADPATGDSPMYAMAAMLMTAIERSATVRTDTELSDILTDGMFGNAERFLQPAARLLELGILDGRRMARTGHA